MVFKPGAGSNVGAGGGRDGGAEGAMAVVGMKVWEVVVKKGMKLGEMNAGLDTGADGGEVRCEGVSATGRSVGAAGGLVEGGGDMVWVRIENWFVESENFKKGMWMGGVRGGEGMGEVGMGKGKEVLGKFSFEEMK